MELAQLQAAYRVFEKTYKLPSFDEVNAHFEIGRIEHDSGNILRDIRKVMVDKVTHYLRLFELMLNPAGASPMFLVLLKEITGEDKKLIDKLFTSFIELELYAYRLDVQSTLADEARFISTLYSVWIRETKDLLALLAILERNWKSVTKHNQKARDYFN